MFMSRLASIVKQSPTVIQEIMTSIYMKFIYIAFMIGNRKAKSTQREDISKNPYLVDKNHQPKSLLSILGVYPGGVCTLNVVNMNILPSFYLCLILQGDIGPPGP